MRLSPRSESEQLAATRAGNPDAFSALVEPHRQPLLIHCYRLSGSLDDAEDLVQDTFLRAWKKLDAYAGQGSFRRWLYVIATRLWLDEARKRKKRVLLPLDGDFSDPDLPPLPLTAAAWLDPLPGSWLNSTDPSPETAYEHRETISLAFMVALQKLNARQRVVLLLREVFKWSAEDVADALDLSVDSINNLLYRARKNLQTPPYAEEVAPPQSLNQLVNAWESGDLHSLIQLLHEKATFAMPPMGVWYAGRSSIGRALQNFVFMPGLVWKLAPTTLNGRPAFAIYRQEQAAYQAFGLLLPVFAGGKIIEVTAFLSPHLVTRSGLPQDLPS
jgi:RNA polymerase sigma-70 factor (ECF subfamily)